MQALVDEFSLAHGHTACPVVPRLGRGAQRPAAEGHRLIREAYEDNTQLGMRAGASEVLGYAAEALLLAGDVEGAQAQLQEALQIADELGEGVYLPQLLLLQAAIARAQKRPEAASASVRRAVEEARKQQAPWLELIALVDLCAARRRLEGGAPGSRRAGGPAARSSRHRAGGARTLAVAAAQAGLRPPIGPTASHVSPGAVAVSVGAARVWRHKRPAVIALCSIVLTMQPMKRRDNKHVEPADEVVDLNRR